jgi:hypothetical protein
MTYVRLRLEVAQILAELCDGIALEDEDRDAVTTLRTEVLHALGIGDERAVASSE